MINCSGMSALCALCSQLKLEQVVREAGTIQPTNLDSAISASDRERLLGWLNIATAVAQDFELQAVSDRVGVITKRLRFPFTQRDFATECRVLSETLHDGLIWHLLYRYPSQKAAILMDWKNAWAPTITSFPTATGDVLASVDLWALNHSTACVFHLMRVLEHGLRALAKDVGKAFDVQNWQNIIDQIESEIRTQGKTLPVGPAKSERLRFLSEAAKEFSFFKDGWRNYVSHGRAAYDEHQARMVMDHVRTFMNGLSALLSEQPS